MRGRGALVLAGLVLGGAPARATGSPPSPAPQDTLRLSAAHELAIRRDPRMARLELEEAATGLRLRSLGAERLPSLVLRGQATEQSEVTELRVDVPGVEIPAPPRERYEVAVNASWSLYDGGLVGARREAERARLMAARAALEAELYPLRLEVNEAYFGALLLREREREIALLVEDLEARLAEVRGGVRAGAALPGDTAAVLAELLRAAQRLEEIAADRRASLAVLSELTGRPIGSTDALALPDLEPVVARHRPAEGGSHPRYAVLDARREGLERRAAVIRAGGRPRLSAFGEYAFGRPGLQQFTDDPHDYWLAGLRVQWQPWDWGTRQREVEAVLLERRMVDAEEAAFTMGLQRQVRRPLEAMDRLRAALETDARIIVLREHVERQARAQLAERAITVATYVDARTDLLEARTTLLRHRVELARARAEYLTTLGVEIP